MAKQTILLCDACGSKTDVRPITASVQNEKYLSDLCMKCLKAMLKEYSLTRTVRSSKTQKVYDFDDIPRRDPFQTG